MEIEVSNGELVDKVIILTIKMQRISSPEKRGNIKIELDLLYEKMLKIGITEKSHEYRQLMEINKKLWDIEDRIRVKESKQQFDDAFVQLARRVYFENDKRSAVKRKININTGSSVIEEKEYVRY
jgi:hypothetical protein